MELIKGLLSLVKGENYGLAYLSEQLKVHTDLIGTCLNLSAFADPRPKAIRRNISKFRHSQKFLRFCQKIKIDHNILLGFVKMSFNLIEYSEIHELLRKLGIQVNVLFINFYLG